MIKLEKLIEGVEGSENLALTYNFLNSKYFGGSIPKIKIKWSGKLKRAIGRAMCKYAVRGGIVQEVNRSSLEIQISTTHDFTSQDLQAILLHEMVHIALFAKNIVGHHHGSSEFDGEIKRLRKESGLDIPFLESNFKPSPKLAAKEGLIGILYLQDGNFGVSTYSKDFIAKNWMEFARVLSRIIENSSRLNRIDLFKATHPVIGTMTAKRNLKKIQWEEIEKETAQEILAFERKGKMFATIDKMGGWIDVRRAGINTNNAALVRYRKNQEPQIVR